MKARIETEQTFCDYCNAITDYSYKCDTCGKDACYECNKKQNIEYHHGVYVSGSGDGTYCKACDAKHLKDGTDLVYNAFQRVRLARIMVQERDDAVHREVKAAELMLELAQAKAKKK